MSPARGGDLEPTLVELRAVIDKLYEAADLLDRLTGATGDEGETT